MPQTKTIKSRITLSEFHNLHCQIDRTNARTIEIDVSRVILNKLIADNTEMYYLLSKEAFTARPVMKGLMYPEGVPVAVHEAIANAPRKNSKKIAIDKKIMLHMLIDHSVLIGKLEDKGYEVQ